MTRKGVWNLQQVRDKYLQDLWENVYGFYVSGDNSQGALGQNNNTQYSSPIQIPGATWSETMPNSNHYSRMIAHTKTDGTMWAWGYNNDGALGQNNETRYSSPAQIPGTTWPKTVLWEKMCTHNRSAYAIKTDGTLWAWGSNYKGNLGLSDAVSRSSPTQVGSNTTWKSISKGAAIKTDGTLWVWGSNSDGGSGVGGDYSSPVQVGSATTWAQVTKGSNSGIATKTDGTLWVWGKNTIGNLGLNNRTTQPAPVQVPGTSWSTAAGAIAVNASGAAGAIRTDGTLWVMGNNSDGALGQNNTTKYSSPVQIPGNTWSTIKVDYYNWMALFKTDGTAWATGSNTAGRLGLNQPTSTKYSSPVQIPGNWKSFAGGRSWSGGIKGSLTASQM